MKSNINILLMIIASFSLLSCSDFLNTSPSTSISDDEVFNTTGGAQAALNGCYYQMRAYDSGGQNRYDDHGIPSLLMYMEVNGEDMIVNGGWYNWAYQYWGETRGDIFRANSIWNFHYRLINNVNAIIDNIDDCDGPEADRRAIKGQALAIRGWAYFSLARLFQQTYIIAKDMPGVPIYTETTNESTESKPRGTLQQTYDQVLSDLIQAEELLEGFNRGSRINNMDQSVTQALLAQVYQVMHNWPKSEEYAKKVLANYPLTTNEQYTGGFSDHTVPSWIWGMTQDEEQNMHDYSPFAMWANDTRKCFTFRCFHVAGDFVKLFEEEDIRRQQMDYWLIVSDDDDIPDRPLWISYKFRDSEDCRGSIIFMRSEEMHLNAIEALARQGKEAEAKQMLWELQDMRNTTRTQATGEELIEAIWLERRKELYGEGYALFDIIRNQRPLLRTGDHEHYSGNSSFPARSWRFIFQIPRNEILNNSALVDGTWPNGDQNPFDGVYEP